MNQKAVVAVIILLVAAALAFLAYESLTQPLAFQVLLVLLGAIVGAAVTGPVTWYSQRQSETFEHYKDLIERIYAPLYDELTAGREKLLGSLQRMDRKEWNRIQSDHLFFWIKPNKLKELLTEIYGKLDGQMVTSASNAQKAVTKGLDNYLRENWRGPTTFAVQVTPSTTETTPHYYQSRPFQILVGPGLFRAIALDEPLPSDANLLAAFTELKKHMNNPQVTGLEMIVDAVRRNLREDTTVKEFKSIFKVCSEKIDNALHLLKKERDQLN